MKFDPASAATKVLNSDALKEHRAKELSSSAENKVTDIERGNMFDEILATASKRISEIASEISKTIASEDFEYNLKNIANSAGDKGVELFMREFSYYAYSLRKGNEGNTARHTLLDVERSVLEDSLPRLYSSIIREVVPNNDEALLQLSKDLKSSAKKIKEVMQTNGNMAITKISNNKDIILQVLKNSYIESNRLKSETTIKTKFPNLYADDNGDYKDGAIDVAEEWTATTCSVITQLLPTRVKSFLNKEADLETRKL